MTKGIDLWSSLKPERSRLHDWTCKAHSNRVLMRNIINWVVIPENCAVDADIAVADKSYDFIQMTDHQAVITTLFLRSPDALNTSPNIPVNLTMGTHHPHVKYPTFPADEVHWACRLMRVSMEAFCSWIMARLEPSTENRKHVSIWLSGWSNYWEKLAPLISSIPVRGYRISNPVQVCPRPQTPLCILPHRRGLQISKPSPDLPTTWQTHRCRKTFQTHYIFILFLIRLSHYQATLLFVTSAISVFRFIIPQPSRDPHPFLFGSPARWVPFISWFVIYLNLWIPC